MGSSEAVRHDISGYLSINNIINNRNQYKGFLDIIVSNSINDFSSTYGAYTFEYFEIEVLSYTMSTKGLFMPNTFGYIMRP